MRSAKKAQSPVVERLEAERHPVHARRGKVREARRLDRGGVRLERDLDLLRQSPMTVRRLDQRRHRRRLHQRRGAAAEEDRGDGAFRRGSGFPGEVAQQRLPPGRLVDGFADMAIEITIRTFGNAERPVDIEGRRRPSAGWGPGG